MTDDSRSQIMHLLEQQKYDDALPILDELMDRIPSDRETRMYHLLVARILILRWNLSRTATEQESYSPTTSKGIIRRLGPVVRVPESMKPVQSFGRMHQAAETALADRSTKRLVTAGAGFVFLIMLAFHMQAGSNAAIRVPSKMVTSTVSVLDAKAYNLSKSGTSDEDGRLTPWTMESGEGNFFRVTDETRDLLPTEHLKHFTGLKPALSGADSARVTPQLNASNAFAERQQAGKILSIESPREPAATKNNGNKAPRKILGSYQSGRAISIRKWPRFAAPTVQNIDRGISLNVLEFVGAWAKVELKSAGATGFVRREWLIPSQRE